MGLVPTVLCAFSQVPIASPDRQLLPKAGAHRRLISFALSPYSDYKASPASSPSIVLASRVIAMTAGVWLLQLDVLRRSGAVPARIEQPVFPALRPRLTAPAMPSPRLFTCRGRTASKPWLLWLPAGPRFILPGPVPSPLAVSSDRLFPARAGFRIPSLPRRPIRRQTERTMS